MRRRSQPSYLKSGGLRRHQKQARVSQRNCVCQQVPGCDLVSRLNYALFPRTRWMEISATEKNTPQPCHSRSSTYVGTCSEHPTGLIRGSFLCRRRVGRIDERAPQVRFQHQPRRRYGREQRSMHILKYRLQAKHVGETPITAVLQSNLHRSGRHARQHHVQCRTMTNTCGP